MKYALVILSFFLIACSKNNNGSPSDHSFLDSSLDMSVRAYRVDLDSDYVKDIRIGVRNYTLSGISNTIYFIVALHDGVNIHVQQQVQPICRDTTGNGPWTVLTHSCNGGASQIRVDSFFATPNLSLAQLNATPVSTIAGDSFMVYKKTFSWEMPTVPISEHEEVEHGFFYGSSTGYILLRVNGRNYGMLINQSHAPFIEKILPL